MVRVFWAAVVRDTQLLLRDKGALVSLFLLPLVFVFVFGSMFGGGDGGPGKPRELPVWHAAGDARGAELVELIGDSGMFAPELAASAEAVRERVAAEDALAGLVIPPDFDPAAGRPAELVIDEGGPLMVRAPLEGAISGLINRWLGGPALAKLTEHPSVVARTPPGIAEPLENADGFQLSVPGNAVLFGFFLAISVALSFVEERKTGTWRRMLAAPAPRPAVLLSRLVPYFIMGMAQMGFLFGAGALAFGMQVGGSVVALVLLTSAVVFCAVALGLLLASFGGSEKMIGSVGSISLLVMGLLGGAMVPRIIMPDTMQTIGLATPHAWALDGYYTLLMREGAGLADVGKQIAVVTGMGALFAAIGSLNFKFER